MSLDESTLWKRLASSRSWRTDSPEDIWGIHKFCAGSQWVAVTQEGSGVVIWESNFMKQQGGKHKALFFSRCTWKKSVWQESVRASRHSVFWPLQRGGVCSRARRVHYSLLGQGWHSPRDYLVTFAQMVCTSKNFLMTNSVPWGPWCRKRDVPWVRNPGSPGHLVPGTT